MEAKYFYTSEKQSQRLLNIGFSRDTSDMYYSKKNKIPKIRVPNSSWHNYHRPCWSFRQLLYIFNKVYPNYHIEIGADTEIEVFIKFFEENPTEYITIDFKYLK